MKPLCQLSKWTVRSMTTSLTSFPVPWSRRVESYSEGGNHQGIMPNLKFRLRRSSSSTTSSPPSIFPFQVLHYLIFPSLFPSLFPFQDHSV